MANDRANARKLLTAAEFKLFEASRRDAICKLDARTLRLKVELTRKRRDKYRDLYKRQRLAIRDQTGTKRGRWRSPRRGRARPFHRRPRPRAGLQPWAPSGPPAS